MQKLIFLLPFFCIGLILTACATTGQLPNDETDGGPDADQDVEEADHCEPNTCLALGKQCGTWPDGCGDVTRCGTCPDGGECTFDGLCPGSDCRNFDCRGFTYCDERTGDCMPGCDRPEQCAENERCNLNTHECQACEDNHHVCQNRCVTNDSVQHCGDRCEPCPTSSSGEVGCDGTRCYVECDELSEFDEETFECECIEGYHECSGECVSNDAVATCGSRCLMCPNDPNGAPYCEEGSCRLDCAELYEFDEESMACVCIAGYHQCTEGCVRNDSIDHCGVRCAPCPTHPLGTPNCDGSLCGFDCHGLSEFNRTSRTCVCIDGYHQCGGECVSDHSVDHCGTRCEPCPTDILGTPNCDGNSCGFDCNELSEFDTISRECVCIEGYHRCTEGCVRNDSVDHCGTRCEPCPTDPHGTPACDGTRCRLTCDDGWRLSTNRCVIDCAEGSAYFDGTCYSFCSTTVDSGGRVGGYSSLALDSSGHPHISYEEWSLGDSNLKYATWNGSDWDIRTIDAEGDTGSHSSLALDSYGYPHISYYSQTDDATASLKYARWTGSEWTIQTVDLEELPGQLSSLALDSMDRPHISYQTGFPGGRNLKYAHFTGSEWLIETIAPLGDSNQSSSLALDSSDRPHISYSSGSDPYDLEYAHFTGIDWVIETVDSTGSVGNYSSIALDSSDFPHIAYYDTTNGALKYAVWTGTEWELQRVTFEDRAGDGTSITIDSDDRPHICFRNPLFGTTQYAQWMGEGMGWQIVTPSSSVGTHHSMSITLDSSDYPHFTHYTFGEDYDLIYTWLSADGSCSL